MNEDIKNIKKRFVNRITNNEQNNIDKANLGFIKTHNDFIKQTLSIVCIHCFDNFIIFDTDNQNNIINMNNYLVYE